MRSGLLLVGRALETPRPTNIKRLPAKAKSRRYGIDRHANSTSITNPGNSRLQRDKLGRSRSVGMTAEDGDLLRPSDPSGVRFSNQCPCPNSTPKPAPLTSPNRVFAQNPSLPYRALCLGSLLRAHKNFSRRAAMSAAGFVAARSAMLALPSCCSIKTTRLERQYSQTDPPRQIRRRSLSF
jgi:hypothetical protein